ncbi:hypothetical protein ABZ477_03795 [Microbacterium sp. NPDC019599]|uniref:hypothetical protein n=1 Tax=Microbacterium sp. NPDC019599 TaxID=3154690 RepID=UPI0033FAA205
MAGNRWSEAAVALASLVVAIVAVIVSIALPLGLQTWANAREDARADEEAESAAASHAEETRQSDALESIAESLGGPNPPVGADSEDDATTNGACRSDGEVFAGGWGPERPLFADAVTPNYLLFNSVTDNPNVGDERAFFVIRDASITDDGGWQTQVKVERGHRYSLRIYIRNDSAYPDAVATGTRVMVNLPTCAGTSIGASAFVTADASFPLQVYANVGLVADEVFNVRFVEDSAELYNNSPNSPFTLPGVESALFTSAGQLIGFDALDGFVKPGYTNASYLYFEIEPQFAE